MSIKYSIVKQPAGHLSKNKKVLYVARACRRERIGLDKISETLAKRSTLSKADIYATLIALAEVIPEYLLNNKTVNLGDLGTMSLHFGSHCEEKPEDVNKNSIKELKVHFRAGKNIKKEIVGADFEKID